MHSEEGCGIADADLLEKESRVKNLQQQIFLRSGGSHRGHRV
jgi:hypothetical protein